MDAYALLNIWAAKQDNSPTVSSRLNIEQNFYVRASTFNVPNNEWTFILERLDFSIFRTLSIPKKCLRASPCSVGHRSEIYGNISFI